ncbi:hypothetical protein ACFY7H_29560 [Streptomyces sp. NPDC012794]|uniref:hypothetical protein n=1 Tax=Streptomyces sp. NPDC012794 TaxID=3364850 RepID=UPI0036B9BF20
MDLTGTLAKIKNNGTVHLGHRDNLLPFSYLSGDPKPMGFSTDLGRWSSRR